MKIEAKPRTIVTIVLVIAILVTGYFYKKKTAPERAYKAEIYKLQLVEEHQRLEILVGKQRAVIDAAKKAAEDAIPKMRLVPDDSPEDPNE